MAVIVTMPVGGKVAEKSQRCNKKAQTKHVKISKLLAALFYILNFD